MSSQPSRPQCHQARLNLRLHPSPRPKSPGHATGARRRLLERTLNPSRTQLLEPPLNRARWFAGFVPTWGFSTSAGGKRMVGRVLLRGDLGGLRLTPDGAGDSFLRGAIVEVWIFWLSLASQWMNTPTVI